MNTVDLLISRYSQHISIQWPDSLPFQQRVIAVVYPEAEERRVLQRVPEFQMATEKAGHTWGILDLSKLWSEWMAGIEYRDSYFEEPDMMSTAMKSSFASHLIEMVRERLSQPEQDAKSVLALSGLGSLYGQARVSEMLKGVVDCIRGRLLLFFPGEKEGPSYRLLGGRDGFDYHAVPITATTGELE